MSTDSTAASAISGVAANETPRKIAVQDAGQHVGERVQIEGWLYNLRKSGKIVFPIVRDGTGLLQCVAVKSNLPEEVFDALKNLTQESPARAPGFCYKKRHENSPLP